MMCVVMICACLTWLPSMAATSATPLSSLQGTTVSDGDTYSISTKEELLKFASLCTEENNWCEGVTFIITDDIDLNDGWTASAEAPETPWETIKMFKGVLDGQGNTLKGFYVEDSIDYKPIIGATGSEHAAGIFCVLSGSTCAVKNLNIENSYIRSRKIAGTVAGVTNSATNNNGLTISNVSSTAIIDSADSYVGGILGVALNHENKASSVVYIDDCSFAGVVSGKTNVGGILGCSWRPILITDCVNTGTVYGKNTTGSNIGGIVGYGSALDGTLIMERCVNKGDVYSDIATNNVNAGGIIGYSVNSLSIKDCVNTGSIELRRSETNKSTVINGCKLGGIIGYVNQKSSATPISLTGCASLGKVMFNQVDDKSKNEANNAVGGLIGDTLGTWHITEKNVTTYYEGAPLSLTDCVVSGTVGGGWARSGGLIGNCMTVNGNITRCLFIGDYDGGNYWYQGGFVGNIGQQGEKSGKLTFTDCYYASQSFTVYSNGGTRSLMAVGSYIGANLCKRNIDVCVTGNATPFTVTESQLGGEIASNYNAMNTPFTSAGCAKSWAYLLSLVAKNTLSAYDFENVWTVLADIPMPQGAAALIEVSDVPAIGNDSGSTVGGSGNQPDDESLVKKTVLLNSNTSGIKILGVRHLPSDSQLNCDWTGSGFEMNIVHEGGDIVFFGDSTNPCYFRVYIDGVAALTEGGSVYHTLGVAPNKIVLADIPTGVHNIKVIKVTGYTLARAQILSVNFAGSIKQDAPTDNELYIEYVGDSISCGWGTIGEHGGAYTDQDGTLAYPLIVSDRLSADYSVTALSGQGLCLGNPGVTDGYLYGSALRSKDTQYAFTRKADAVVINIGTNDYWNVNVTESQFKAAYKAFLETVREKNGEDCKILCLYNTMNDTYSKVLLEACAEFGGETAGVYTYKTAITNNGLHPNIAEQSALADAVVEQLADILEISDDNIGEGSTGGGTTGDDTTGGDNTDDDTTGEGNDQGGVTLPDKFDPSLGLGDDEDDTEGESETESDYETETVKVDSSDGNGASAEIIIAIVLGTLFALSLGLNIVLICILLSRKKKEKNKA